MPTVALRHELEREFWQHAESRRGLVRIGRFVLEDLRARLEALRKCGIQPTDSLVDEVWKSCLRTAVNEFNRIVDDALREAGWDPLHLRSLLPISMAWEDFALKEQSLSAICDLVTGLVTTIDNAPDEWTDARLLAMTSNIQSVFLARLRGEI